MRQVPCHTNLLNVDLRQIAITVAQEVYDEVAPHFGAVHTREIVGESKSGDFTFALDVLAEERLERAVARIRHDQGIALSYYSEDQGLVTHEGKPEYVLVVDPVDGTRPAVCGFESSCVSVALAKLRGGTARFSDTVAACLIELKSGRIISAEKGAGVYLAGPASKTEQRIDGKFLSRNTDLARLRWSFETCARPAEASFMLLGELIDKSSFGGGTFIFNSSSFSISRIALGQLDASLDPYAALLDGPDGKRWEARSRELFGGKVFGLFAYDIAAAVLIATEAGAVVTDAFGKPLDNVDMLQSSEASILSCIAAANPELSRQLVHYMDRVLHRPE